MSKFLCIGILKDEDGIDCRVTKEIDAPSAELARIEFERQLELCYQDALAEAQRQGLLAQAAPEDLALLRPRIVSVTYDGMHRNRANN